MIFNCRNLPVFTYVGTGKYTFPQPKNPSYYEVAVTPNRNFAHKNTHNFWNEAISDE